MKTTTLLAAALVSLPFYPSHPPLGRPLQRLHLRRRPQQMVLVKPSRALPVLHPRLLARRQVYFPLRDLQKPQRHALPPGRPVHARFNGVLERAEHAPHRTHPADQGSHHQQGQSVLSFFDYDEE